MKMMLPQSQLRLSGVFFGFFFFLASLRLFLMFVEMLSHPTSFEDQLILWPIMLCRNIVFMCFPSIANPEDGVAAQKSSLCVKESWALLLPADPAHREPIGEENNEVGEKNMLIARFHLPLGCLPGFNKSRMTTTVRMVGMPRCCCELRCS